jgi:hypothetical protein
VIWDIAVVSVYRLWLVLVPGVTRVGTFVCERQDDPGSVGHFIDLARTAKVMG